MTNDAAPWIAVSVGACSLVFFVHFEVKFSNLG